MTLTIELDEIGMDQLERAAFEGQCQEMEVSVDERRAVIREVGI